MGALLWALSVILVGLRSQRRLLFVSLHAWSHRTEWHHWPSFRCLVGHFQYHYFVRRYTTNCPLSGGTTSSSGYRIQQSRRCGKWSMVRFVDSHSVQDRWLLGRSAYVRISNSRLVCETLPMLHARPQHYVMYARHRVSFVLSSWSLMSLQGIICASVQGWVLPCSSVNQCLYSVLASLDFTCIPYINVCIKPLSAALFWPELFIRMQWLNHSTNLYVTCWRVLWYELFSWNGEVHWAHWLGCSHFGTFRFVICLYSRPKFMRSNCVVPTGLGFSIGVSDGAWYLMLPWPHRIAGTDFECVLLYYTLLKSHVHRSWVTGRFRDWDQSTFGNISVGIWHGQQTNEKD